MQNPAPLNPDLYDWAPTADAITPYDRDHMITYLRTLDASAQGAAWEDVARTVLRIDPEREPDRAKRAYESHLARAKWMTEEGYRHLLRRRGERQLLPRDFPDHG
jgi:hypothetical protein